MKNPPVFFVIGQVQHNPILNLATYLAEIQARLRKAGYPDFQRMSQMQLDFQLALNSQGTDAMPSPTMQHVERYMCANTAGTDGFILQTNSLSFQTTAYTNFDDFLVQLKLGLGVLSDVVGISFVDRIGIRYLDAISPVEGDLRKYLAAELLGHPATMAEGKPHRTPEKARFLYSFSEAVLVAEDIGQVVCRTIIQDAQLKFPPDLQPFNLKIADRFAQVSGLHAVLDTDSSFSGRRDFDVGQIETHLRDLQGLAKRCFDAATTDYAQREWTTGVQGQ